MFPGAKYEIVPENYVPFEATLSQSVGRAGSQLPTNPPPYNQGFSLCRLHDSTFYMRINMSIEFIVESLKLEIYPPQHSALATKPAMGHPLSRLGDFFLLIFKFKLLRGIYYAFWDYARARA